MESASRLKASGVQRQTPKNSFKLHLSAMILDPSTEVRILSVISATTHGRREQVTWLKIAKSKLHLIRYVREVLGFT